MKKDYEKAFNLMDETVSAYKFENQILLDRLYYLRYFVENWCHEKPNGKQEFSVFKVKDILLDIINGNVKIEIERDDLENDRI